MSRVSTSTVTETVQMERARIRCCGYQPPLTTRTRFVPCTAEHAVGWQRGVGTGAALLIERARACMVG